MLGLKIIYNSVILSDNHKAGTQHTVSTLKKVRKGETRKGWGLEGGKGEERGRQEGKLLRIIILWKRKCWVGKGEAKLNNLPKIPQQARIKSQRESFRSSDTKPLSTLP